MANKTVPAGLKVSDYLNQIEDPKRQADCRRLHDLSLGVFGETVLRGIMVEGVRRMDEKYPR